MFSIADEIILSARARLHFKYYGKYYKRSKNARLVFRCIFRTDQERERETHTEFDNSISTVYGCAKNLIMWSSYSD